MSAAAYVCSRTASSCSYSVLTPCATSAPRPLSSTPLYLTLAARAMCGMQLQVARSLLRASTWRCSFPRVAHSSFPLVAPRLQSRSLVNSASFRSIRAASTHSGSSSASSTPQYGVRQALELGVQLPELCSGCGVNLQAEDPDAPGYAPASAQMHHNI